MSTFVRPRWTGFGRAVLIGALVTLFGTPSGVSAQELADKYQQNRERLADSPRARFSLHAEASVVLAANQFQCGLVNTGDTCTDVFDSPTGGGGFWPTGSPNQYMFNSGIMIAGIIPANAGFEWAGDTTGAFFFDASGTQQHGTPITNIYNSLDPADVAAWPSEGSVPGFPFATAFIVDEDIFSPVLTEGGLNGGPRAVGSQQDTWVMYWDGDPGLSANRDHPMGVAIEQRTMAWNFPAGNEATLYLFYKITNVTNNETFQQLNELRFGIELPDAGWAFDSVYLAYAADPDVTTDATENFGTVILPFNMGITYHALFVAPEFSYPPSLFFPPFFTAAPGIVGVQYLRSPANLATPDPDDEVGLTLFSIYENPNSCAITGGLCDPQGDKQLWRYVSGNIRPALGDNECTFPNPKQTRICYLPQGPADVRFLQASGPFSLGPGESATIVVAMMAAPTVSTPDIIIGADNTPGVPGLRPGCGDDEILPIEVGAGWVSTPQQACADTPDDEVLDLRDINVVPGSLLGRGQVAQAVFDERFLLPFAPEPPPFFLVPGDNQVVVIWDQSATEMDTLSSPGDTLGGDPFFAAAQDTASALFNPNYRRFDVEGYRVYRSTDNSNFELIAQFDYANTEFTDVRCEADRSFVPGVDPPCSDTTTFGINDITDIDDDFIDDPFVLFGGANAQRLRLSDGRTLAIRGDTATPGDTPDLSDTGIPFAYIDTDVRNGFRYFYQVRAFDINSTFSGPISLESSSETKNTIPQAPSSNQVLASFSQEMQGADGTVLDPTAGYPAVDSDDGTFAGPMPPTNTLEATFAPLVPRLLPAFTLTARIDSVQLGGGSTGVPCTNSTDQLGGCWNMHMTFDNNGVITNSVAAGYTPVWDNFGGLGFVEWLLGQTPVEADEASLVEFGVPVDEFDLSFNAALQGGFDEAIFNSSAEGQLNRRTLDGSIERNVSDGGSRWFDGTEETVADPTRNIRVGHLDAVDTVWSPVHNTPVPSLSGANYPAGGVMQCYSYGVSTIARVADLRVTWTGGTITVEDVTHHVPVEFKPTGAQSWGFVRDGNANGHIDWRDFDHIERIGNNGAFRANAFCAAPADAALTQLSATPVLDETSTSGAAAGSTTITGDGFGLYINAQRYIFETADGNPPADGTVWTLRTYHGYLTADENPTVLGSPSTNPGDYSLVLAGSGLVDARPPFVPGLTVVFESFERTQLVGDADLSLIHTIPDPYYAQSRYDLSPVEKALRFVNLPPQATIRIYTVSGLLVDIINHNDPAAGGMDTWDLKNRSGQFVASGVYFYHVSTPNGQEHIGRFTVINSGIGQ